MIRVNHSFNERKRSGAIVWLLLAATRLLGAAEPSLRVVSGNIFLVQNDGTVVQLTATGRDSMPSLSNDGRKIVFVRSRQGGPDDLRLIDLDLGNSEKSLNVSFGALENKDQASEIFDPQFAPDASAIYFFTKPGNLGMVVRTELASKESNVIAHSVLPMPKRSFNVIERGKYAGDLIVYKDSEKLSAGRFFLYWLIDGHGGNVAIIADKVQDLELFREEEIGAMSRE